MPNQNFLLNTVGPCQMLDTLDGRIGERVTLAHFIYARNIDKYLKYLQESVRTLCVSKGKSNRIVPAPFFT
jgi:hypothetical protein